MMAHHHNMVGHPGVTQLQATLQQTYYWPQIAADITSAIHDCVHCVKYQAQPN